MPPPAAHLKSLTRVPLSSGASDHNESKTGSQVKAPPFFLHFVRMFSSESRFVGRLSEEGD